jgi:hypothetical protein
MKMTLHSCPVPGLIRLLFFIAFLVPEWNSGMQAQQYFTAETSHAVKLGRTKPLHDFVSIDPTDSTKLQSRKSNKPYYVPNFGGRRHQDIHVESALPQGADPLFNPQQIRMPGNEILPKVNVEGIHEAAVFSGVPDVNGDISRDYYVEVVNATHFRVFDKAGQPVSSLISANSIWSQVQQSSAGDPILLYDQEADRWLLTEFPSNNRVLLAISVTNDPLGSWDAYAFQTPRFPDFPKYGIWHDAYYLTTNEGGAQFPIYAFNREDMLAGADMIRFQRLTVPKISGVFFEVGQPIDWDGMNPPPAGSPGLVVKLNDDDWGTTSEDLIVLHKIHIDWDTASKSNIEVIEIPTAPYDSDGCSLENTGGFSCVPQPNGQGIDGAEWIITNKAQYRNFGTHESFVMCFMVDVTGEEVAGIRWMEFRKTPTQDWFIYQEGTIGSDDGIHRFMSSIGIDGQGNIAIGYSVSGFDKHPSLRYTGRYATDPPGMMTFQEYEFATGSGSLGDDRFGDYACMSVDPSDDLSFWFAGEYVLANGNWATRIVSFSAARDTIDLLPVSLLSPQSGPGLSLDEPISISILNRGINQVDDFSVAYQFNDENWIIEQATVDSLEVDSFYTHTFLQGLDFNTPGTFALKVATILDADRNHRNDTLSFIIQKPAFRDVTAEYDVNSQNGIVCADVNLNTLILRNLGVDTARSIDIEVTVNGLPVDTLSWTGELLTGHEENITIETPALNEGENIIRITLLSVNSMQDEITGNNQIEWTLQAKPSGAAVFLHLTTDNFPQETTWELTDANNTLIASGGPYTDQQNLYTEPLCLDPDTCYIFTIYDAFGDGVSAQGVFGDYQIVNSEGLVLSSLSKPNFGLSETNQFCLTGECLLELTAGVEHESSPGSSDAWVMAEVANALGGIIYSINGGESFQTNNIFQNLSPGNYLLIAVDDAGCSDSVTIEILSCDLQTMITTIPAVGGDVGQIHISASGGTGQLSYSLNGNSFSNDSFFIMLEPGAYIVTTRDSIGCEKADTVIVSTQVSTIHLSSDDFIRIFPNPGRGVYDVIGIVESSGPFIPFRILTIDGMPLFNGFIGRYNDTYKGEISMVAYTPGIYFAVFYIDDRVIVHRLIKVE